jgi:predicted transcriptional regulator
LENVMSNPNPLSHTTEIVRAYLECNHANPDEVPELIRSVHRALSALGTAEAQSQPNPSTKATAAQIRRSIAPEALISFEDGKPYKMLKRHLTKLGLTPQAYRQKWGLPQDYPMTSPSYSAARSHTAKASGLGKEIRRLKGARRAAR